MPCTTILVGKKASYDGSTIISRNDDAGADHFTPKRFTVVRPEEQPRVYQSVLSKVRIPLPGNPMRYTAVPNALPGQGIWAASGVNEANVGMTATETITSNERVRGADPLVKYIPAKDGQPEKAGGIGEEDLVVLVLPYIRSAREGVLRLGGLLKEYGTYEMNGIAFQDVDEIWWLETIGGHHWMAKRVPDDEYVVMPNQQGIDEFDFEDAYGEQKEHLCSEDLLEFVRKNHLDLSLDGTFHARLAFGSRADSDHSYNTCRAWDIEKKLNPNSFIWDGPDADFGPESDDIPWSLEPEHKLTIEDVKYALSCHYQGTPYDPYGPDPHPENKGKYRPVGVNRTDFLSIIQIRPYVPEAVRAVQWITFGSNVFNTMAPFYTNADSIPEYLSGTTGRVSTDSFYWANRLIGTLADAHYRRTAIHIERYALSVMSQAHALLTEYDSQAEKLQADDCRIQAQELCEKANQKIADMLKTETDKALDSVLFEASSGMKNAFARSDA